MDDRSIRNDIYNPSILIDGCNVLGISLSRLQIRQFLLYYDMLCERNRVMNLTAVTNWEEVQVRHYLDSLLLCRTVDLSGRMRVLDLGSGAGFPGIPLKIAFPHLEVVLADSLNKRILFLNDVVQELGLTGVEAVHGRAEDLGRQSKFREQFDLTVSRAVANLSSLCEYCLPFVRPEGFFVSYKAEGAEEEIEAAQKAIRVLGGRKTEAVSLPLPCSDISRVFVKIRKIRNTPAAYPRKAGTPARNPL